MAGPDLHAWQGSDPIETRRVVDGLFDPYVLLMAIRNEQGAIVDFVYTEANAAACEFNGLPYEQLVGSRLLDILPGHAGTGLFQRYIDVVETGTALRIEGFAYDQELRGGVTHWFNVQAVKVGDGLSYTWRDVTDHYATTFDATAALRSPHQAGPDSRIEDYYQVIAENSLDIVLRTDQAGIITWISPSVAEVLGWQPVDVVGRPSAEFMHTGDFTDVARLAQIPPMPHRDRVLNEARVRTAAGSWHWMRAHGRTVLDIEGMSAGQIITLQDIHREIETRSELAFAMHHDPLTGLPNRQTAVERLGALLACTDDDQMWVLCIGVDDLNDIYQAITDSAGEPVLEAVAGALREAVGMGDWVFRGAGNEFLIVLPQLESAATAAAYAQRIIGQVHRPMCVGNDVLDITVSIGVARANRIEDPQVVLRRATAAMLQARQRGRGQWGFLDVTLSDAVRTRLVTASELQAALSAHRIGPWLQPVLSLHDGRLQGYEALARWETADGHVMPPATFIPIAESTGLVCRWTTR